MARPQTTVRNLDRTREKILAAALAEFSARGFAGARVDAIARRALFEKAVGRLRVLQRKGSIPHGVDLPQLFISMLALAMFPLVMPQIIRLIHGMEPTDPRFMRERADFLRWLGDGLAEPARTSRIRPRRGQSSRRPSQLA